MKSGKVMLAERSLCISYGRLRQLSTDISNSVIALWEKEGVVFSSQATKRVFTTGGIENIDYNPSSTSAKSQSILHGTGISILQYISINHTENPQDPILNIYEMGQKE
jgi:hypothetical protein